MENILRKATHTDDPHPEYNRLEVKGTWSGNMDEPVNLQISLEVRCTPKTHIQLLSLRPSYISFICSSICRQPDVDVSDQDQDQHSQSTESFSPSLLPTISDPGFDDDEYDEYNEDEDEDEEEEEEEFDTYDERRCRDLRSPLPMIPEESPEQTPPPATAALPVAGDKPWESSVSVSEGGGVRIADSRAASESAPPILQSGSSGSVLEIKPSDSGLVEEPAEIPIDLAIELAERANKEGDRGFDRDFDQDTESSSRLLYSYPSLPRELYDDDYHEAKSEDCSVLQNQGKRTATDACLTDSEPGESGSQTETKIHRTATKEISFSSPSGESDVQTQTGQISDGTRKPRGKHSRRFSFSPKRVQSTGELESRSQSTGPRLYRVDAVVRRKRHSETNNPTDTQEEEIKNAPQEDKGNGDLAPTSTAGTIAPGPLATDDSEPKSEVEETLNTQSKVASDDLIMFGSDDDEQPTELDEPFSPIPVEHSEFIMPSTPTPTSAAEADTAAEEASGVHNTGTESNVEKALGSPEVIADDLPTYDPYEGTPTEVDEGSVGPTTPVKSTPMLPTPTSTDTAAQEAAVVNDATALDVEPLPETPKFMRDDSPDTDQGTLTEADEDDDGPGSPTPVVSRFVTPPTLSLEKPSTPQSDEHSQDVANEPRLYHIDGIVVVINPPNANSETYRIAITVSVKLQQGKSKGWNDLIIPGLPKLKTGESGLFIFQRPESHGVEFRTTSFYRHELMEDRFLAEFSSSKDLVVPLRVCNRVSYGTVKDFTVDQEIRSDHVVHSVQGDAKGNKAKLVVTYNAVCSLKLHNHCFWAEKCCFFLYLDGGPNGNFRHEINPSRTGPPVINLDCEGIPAGVAHIQITCSPKDLEMFCVIWKVKCSGREVSKWLPRIYPESTSASGRGRHYLRYIFAEYETDAASWRQGDDGGNVRPVRPAGSTKDLVPLPGHYEILNDDCSRWTMLFKRALTAIAIILALFLLFGPDELKHDYLDSLGVLPGASNLESPVELNQSNVDEAPHTYDWKPDAYEVVDVAGDKNIESETPAVDDQPDDTEIKEEPELGAESNATAKSQTLPLSWRDKVDYFLGWKGPVRQQVE